MANALTDRQTEVLGSITGAGPIKMHLQTGPTQRVIRALAAKELVTIGQDGYVTARPVAPPKHYGHAEILAAGVDIGDGWKRATIELAEGETVWNPYSTKKIFKGAGSWTFRIHPASIELESAPDTLREVYLPSRH